MISVCFAPAGSLVHLKQSGMPPLGGGQRGMVSGFSRQSRSRLMQRVAMLSRNRMPLFVTLTYPADFPTVERAKANFQAFDHRLKYHYPESGLLWKLEFQRRGAPHFHFFLWGLTLEQAREFVPLAWAEVVGSSDFELHYRWHAGELQNEHCVQLVRSWRGVASYAGKYLGKLPEPQEATGEVLTGRIWGFRGKVPFSPILTFRLDLSVALTFRRAHRRFTGMRKSGRRLGFWSFGFVPDWLIFLETVINAQCQPPPCFPPGWYRGQLGECPDDLAFLF